MRAILLDPARTEMSPRAETLLFNAARAQIVDQVIRPALAAGQLVLCDRYADSTLAYQGYGHGQALEPLHRLADYATGGLVPHLTIYLDIDVREGLLRKQSGQAEEWNRMEEKALAFHQRCALVIWSWRRRNRNVGLSSMPPSPLMRFIWRFSLACNS